MMIEVNNILDIENYLLDIKGVVFDLDDTLYSEREYVYSGFKEIAKEFSNRKDIEELLINSFNHGEKPLDMHFKQEDKIKALEIYRNHTPSIHLYEGVREMLLRIKNEKKLGLITDGRPEGQRAKITALGIDKIISNIIITDELGGIDFRKPNEVAFILMKETMALEYDEMVYIGDNLKKDFVAPGKLGMKYIYFNNKDGLY